MAPSILFIASTIATLLYLARSQTVLQSFVSDATLTLENSPYIVNTYVTFSSASTITIENGVQIIFIGSYFISVFGGLNCGCDGTTINDQIKGLADNARYVHLLGNESIPTSTGLFINHVNQANPPSIQFCNTLFERTQNGIVTTAQQYAPYTVHNCEFTTINKAIHHSANMVNVIYNSYFHNINHVKSSGNVIYDNCLFEDFGKFSYNTERAMNIAVRNSEIRGDGVQICLNVQSVVDDGDASMAIHNNLITNCLDGIEVWNAINITNNTITNCTRYGIHAHFDDTTTTTTTAESPLFHISHNQFAYNVGNDLVLMNVNNALVSNNRFTTQYEQSACIECMDSDMVQISQNRFVELVHDSLMWFNYCSNVNVTNNQFASNTIKNGMVSSVGTRNLEISDNHFTQNRAAFIAKVTDIDIGGVFDLYRNDVSNNIVSQSLFNLNRLDEVYLDGNSMTFNSFDSNKAGRKLLDIQNTNYLYFGHNQLLSNRLNAVLMDNTLNSNMLLEYNTFSNNTATNSSSNLVAFEECEDISIRYNSFEDNVNIDNILYLSHLHAGPGEITEIKNNQFAQSVPSTLNQYIHASGDVDALLQINYNNFNDPTNIVYFISTNNIRGDLNDNYWSFETKITYHLIKSKIENICPHPIVSASEYPIDRTLTTANTASNLMTCSWHIVDCDTVSDYSCESDTLSPTAPSIAPTPSPALSVLVLTPNPTAAPTKPNELIVEADTVSPTASPSLSAPNVQMSDSIQDEDDTFLIIAGSAGITVIFLVLGTILLYVFWKLRKLKQETETLNLEIKDKGHTKSVCIDAFGNDVFVNPSTMVMKHSTVLSSDGTVVTSDDPNSFKTSTTSPETMHFTPRPPLPVPQPRHKSTGCVLSHDQEEKLDQLYMTRLPTYYQQNNPFVVSTQHHAHHQSGNGNGYPIQPPHAHYVHGHARFISRDNSSELYRSYQGIVEIEGNETHLATLDYDLDDIDIPTTGIVGELSLTQHTKNESQGRLVLKPIDIAPLDEYEDNLQSGNPFRYRPRFPDVDNIQVDDEADEDGSRRTNLQHAHSQSDTFTNSNEETSESSPSFTINSDEDRKFEIDITMQQHNGYLNLKSPTNGFSPVDGPETPRTPVTPQMPQTPNVTEMAATPKANVEKTETPKNESQAPSDQILHSWEFAAQNINAEKKAIARKPTDSGSGAIGFSPGGGIKLPKPMTKGQWM